jgi:hypothetical protein
MVLYGIMASWCSSSVQSAIADFLVGGSANSSLSVIIFHIFIKNADL